jgi:hypothetical protein
MVGIYNEKKMRQLQDDLDLNLINAYYSASFQRAKKMPNLKNILKKNRIQKQQRNQKPEDILKILMIINEACGGEFVVKEGENDVNGS